MNEHWMNKQESFWYRYRGICEFSFLNIIYALILCRSSTSVESRILDEECVHDFMSKDGKLEFEFNPKIKRTFQRNKRKRQRQRANIMKNQNNHIVPVNQVAQDTTRN